MIERFDDTNYWLSKHVVPNSESIDRHLETAFTVDRSIGTKDIIPILRHFVESVICYLVSDAKNIIIPDPSSHKSVKNFAVDYVCKNKSKYEFLNVLYDLHQNIQHAASHETVFYGDYAERLFIKYYDSLIKIRLFFKKQGIDILHNLSKYPKNMDESLLSYYRTIIKGVEYVEKNKPIGSSESFYILDKKTISIDDYYYYEYTLSVVDDNKNKADKIIAFSRINIFDNYALILKIYRYNVSIFGVDTDIEIIIDYDVAVRTCEFNKMASILGIHGTFTKSKETYNLMSYIKSNQKSIADIIKLPYKDFLLFKREVFTSGRETMLLKMMMKAREYFNKKVYGYNTMLYLLATMNNSILYEQTIHPNDVKVNSLLELPTAIVPFEKTPFCANLRGTIIASKYLFETIDIDGHECELIKREIDKQTLNSGLIYCSGNVFKDIEDIDKTINDYNNKIGHYEKMEIKTYKNKDNECFYYVGQNEITIYDLLKKIFSFYNIESIPNYSNYARGKININSIVFDDPNKEKAAIQAFNGRRIYTVYGPAGTGKSFFANKLLDILDGYSTLCISSTHASIGNLKRKLINKKAVFKVVEQIIKSNSTYWSKYDVVIVDECSTISNKDMLTLLEKISPRFLLLLGDTYQIEAIDFGNWFSLLKTFVPPDSFIHLDNCFRTTSEVMKNIWQLTRDIDPNLSETFKNYEISKPIDQTILTKKYDDDNITLCLNYGGLYGINNINKLMQSKNQNKSFEWRRHIYKVGDPILFKETKYYKDIFYNNLKGTILDFKVDQAKMTFLVKVKDYINNAIADLKNIRIKAYGDDNTTTLEFDIYKYNTDAVENDLAPAYVVPFNIAYAISIHKSQGLEFKNVDVIISGEVKEVISHNIFYTAITRARENLSIYWSPETENAVIKEFEIKNYRVDVAILKNKFPELKTLLINYHKNNKQH